MMKRILMAGAFVVLGTSAALAGKATLKHDSGAKVRLACSSGGCFATETDAAGNKGKRTKIGPGGSSNFQTHKAKYKAKGYN